MSAPTYDLGKLHGGIRLPAEKEQSTAQPITHVPVPAQLVLPLAQHTGEPAHPVVGIGEKVLKGQVVAEADGTVSAPVHASSSGTVVAIEPWPVSRRRGDKAPCIIIECDGEDRAVDPVDAIEDFTAMKPRALQEQILRGGIVGLGGAAFPTAQKLMQAVSLPLEQLILNGVECESYISCDDMLMREYADEVVRGSQVLMHALGIKKCFIVLESDKPEAIKSIGAALAELDDPRIVLKQVPTIYPSGGEDQLVQLVTNTEVPSGGLPSDVGCVVQNVGTAAAVYRWIVKGEPLISRVTTVTGDGVATPCNVLARIGTTLADVIEATGGYTERARLLVVGGPMTGKSLSTDQVPLVKATNCVLVMSEFAGAGEEKPCIRCGACSDVCPVQLLPQQLFWYACADNEAKLRYYGLTDCIECGCCDLVCPSHIPLTWDFRNAKGRLRELADEKARAERARRRFESHTERLTREQQEREQQLAEQKRKARKVSAGDIKGIMKRARDKKNAPKKDD
ncbi:MAG: electron transport complex subunit RsxC [Woeseia sp.]